MLHPIRNEFKERKLSLLYQVLEIEKMAIRLRSLCEQAESAITNNRFSASGILLPLVEEQTYFLEKIDFKTLRLLNEVIKKEAALIDSECGEERQTLRFTG
ncbi:MAG: hypothetical protein CV087_24305 [Candidatus Brocadia sp. WS118]|nr:MAG: hypothetical protein CV087_24305 [Candidatus Brocadia sp. WS118]